MKYLEQWLKRNNMNRQELADALGMSKSAIDKIAAGTMKLSKRTKLAMQQLEGEKK